MPGRVTAHELDEYWEYIENLADNSVIEKYIATSQMPPWDEICSGLNWQTYALDDGYFGKKRHGYCGVYRLIGLTTDEPFKPDSIRRVCGEDGTGTLYIGESGWLNERLNQLRRSLRREDTHGASRMWKQSPTLNTKFPANKLGVSILFTGARMSKWIERDLIRAYLSTFGDTPPLNCSF